MKIAAWNLNHRTLPKAIPPSLVEVVKNLAPDVLVLTEYVDGGDRAASYVTDVGRAIVAGPGKIDPISDHAIIICEVMA